MKKTFEKEWKLVVLNKPFDYVCTQVAQVVESSLGFVWQDTDVYYAKPNLDFIRVRYDDHGYIKDITAKRSLKNGDTQIRQEIKIPVTGQEKNQNLDVFFGPKQGIIIKKYRTFFIKQDGTEIAVYQLKGNSVIFVEIESNSIKNIRHWYKKLKQTNLLFYARCVRSLYEMYILKKPMDLVEI